ncbi:hypothetical protein AAIR98_001202 [Elusimicrobium simillimum]|uniref:PEGA domain-containing protein n=1 Tax=Elusimicrobium simillimum TaxID=3143438 RepID=UPI003C6FDFF4
MKKLLSLFLAVCLISGCSVMGGTKQKLTVMSNVDGADVYINGQKVGVTNSTFKVKRNQEAQIMAKKEGYKTGYAYTSTQLSKLGVVDLVAGCVILIPFIGLAFPGAHKLSHTNLVVEMEKEAA